METQFKNLTGFDIHYVKFKNKVPQIIRSFPKEKQVLEMVMIPTGYDLDGIEVHSDVYLVPKPDEIHTDWGEFHGLSSDNEYVTLPQSTKGVTFIVKEHVARLYPHRTDLVYVGNNDYIMNEKDEILAERFHSVGI